MFDPSTPTETNPILGIIANTLGLPGSANLVVWAINGLLLLVWILLVGRRLLQIASNVNTLAGGEKQ